MPHIKQVENKSKKIKSISEVFKGCTTLADTPSGLTNEYISCPYIEASTRRSGETINEWYDRMVEFEDSLIEAKIK